MEWGRLKLASRGEPLIIAQRDALLPSENEFVLSGTEACGELEWLPRDAIERLVEAFQTRFPNTRDPEKTRRVMAYVKDRVATGTLAIVRRR